LRSLTFREFDLDNKEGLETGRHPNASGQPRSPRSDLHFAGFRKRRSEEKSHSDVQARFASLTQRERQIMGFVTGGLMNKQVAGTDGQNSPRQPYA
jgi:ATP/maltotriose-dependent transcriptional regulator MalT